MVRNEILRTLFPLRLRQWRGPLIAVGATGGIVALIVIGTGIIDLSASIPHPTA